MVRHPTIHCGNICALMTYQRNNICSLYIKISIGKVLDIVLQNITKLTVLFDIIYNKTEIL